MIDHKSFVIGLEDLKNLRGKKADLEKQVEDTNGEISELLFDLIEYMEVTDHESVKIAGIGNCSLTRTKKYSIDNPLAFEEWMNANGDMVEVMAVHAMKVHGFYKERLENDEELPPGVKTFIKSNITIRS